MNLFPEKSRMDPIMNENAETQRRYGAKNSTTLRDSLAFCAFLVKLEKKIRRERCEYRVFSQNKTAWDTKGRGKSIKQPLRISAYYAVKSDGFYTVQHRS
jgi:hypothetical protein